MIIFRLMLLVDRWKCPYLVSRLSFGLRRPLQELWETTLKAFYRRFESICVFMTSKVCPKGVCGLICISFGSKV